MKKELDNILFINTGGGIGDALSSLAIFNYINKNFSVKKLYYFSNDFEYFWFENKLKEYRPKNLITIKNFPIGYGFKFKHRKISKKLIDLFDFNQFDLIIDNQTRVNNSLVFKKIPHKYFISPCMNFLLSKPFYFTKKNNNLTSRIINYFNKVHNENINPDYNIKIPNDFLDKSKQLMTNNNKYIGFSITAGHPTRDKEFQVDEIIKVANYFSEKKYIPTFFIEKKYVELKNLLKEKVENAFFPEELVDEKFQNPMIVTALGSLTEFNITIDNGISHMLSFSNNKNYIFYNESSDKFKPASEKCTIFDCKLNNTKISSLKSDQIIEFVNSN